MHTSSKHTAVDHLPDPLSCLELEQMLQNVRKSPWRGFLSWERVAWILYMWRVSMPPTAGLREHCMVPKQFSKGLSTRSIKLSSNLNPTHIYEYLGEGALKSWTWNVRRRKNCCMALLIKRDSSWWLWGLSDSEPQSMWCTVCAENITGWRRGELWSASLGGQSPEVN